MIRSIKFEKIENSKIHEKPFRHIILDDFFDLDTALALSEEFPSYDSEIWLGYNNPIEIKKINSHWHKFGPLTYKILAYLNGADVVRALESKFGMELFSDPGLHGGGWHIHAKGGKLNPHLDYNIHPKLGGQRKLNLIVYLTPNWLENWGGGLGMWDGVEMPKNLVSEVTPKFNRAVIFETVGSWHGLPEPIKCPDGEYRKSIAVYYLSDADSNAEKRLKARFAPYGSQLNNPEIDKLIEDRVSVETAKDVYE